MLGRIGLFMLTNILIITMVAIVTGLLGVGGYMTQTGLDYGALLVFCLIWGMAGSFISLALSRWMAKKLMRVHLVNPESPGELHWYRDMVYHLAKRADLPAMPEVGIYESNDLNAFATGPTRKRSLVAVSTGLLGSMNRDELEGVLAHEIGHIRNGDMVTMVLIQGVINAFVMFFARVIAFFVSGAVRNELRWVVNIAVIIVLQILFGMLGMMVTGWFSRQREFRADRSSAQLAGREKMTAALEKLLQAQPAAAQIKDAHPSFASLKISGKKSKFSALFSTHPPLEVRIAALKG